jgi:hypothetical protein
MTVRPNPEADAAMQYLVWALEEIEKSGHHKAARHARMALEELSSTPHPSNETDEHVPSPIVYRDDRVTARLRRYT